MPSRHSIFGSHCDASIAESVKYRLVSVCPSVLQSVPQQCRSSDATRAENQRGSCGKRNRACGLQSMLQSISPMADTLDSTYENDGGRTFALHHQ